MPKVPCLTHASCASGYCPHGFCENPTQEGQPCRPDTCPPGLHCHPVQGRCRPLGFVPTHFCRVDEDCTVYAYCQGYTHLCDVLAVEGSVCGPAKRCADGLECREERCRRGCWSAEDCVQEEDRKFECQRVEGNRYERLCLPLYKESIYSAYDEFLLLLGPLFVLAFVLIFWWAKKAPAR